MVARSMISGHAASATTHRCARANTQSCAEDDHSQRRAPDTLTRRRERIAGIHGLSIDTIELYEMIDELAPRLVHGSYR